MCDRYHGGAFVGNDCVRLLKNHQSISQSIKPRNVKLPDGSIKQFGNAQQTQTAHTLLNILYQLDALFSLPRPLCRHEVAIYCMRAYSFGNWFPVHFPAQRITPKMHVMIYHMSQFAQRYHTIGMFSEQAGESIHNVFNKLNRQYAPIACDVQRIKTVMQKCMLMHDPRIVDPDDLAG